MSHKISLVPLEAIKALCLAVLLFCCAYYPEYISFGVETETEEIVCVPMKLKMGNDGCVN